VRTLGSRRTLRAYGDNSSGDNGIEEVAPSEHKLDKRRYDAMAKDLYTAEFLEKEQTQIASEGPFHVFLSHNWLHGQATMRIIKNALREMLPGVSVFLGYKCDSNLPPPGLIKYLGLTGSTFFRQM
jgi:hypothetical protein